MSAWSSGSNSVNKEQAANFIQQALTDFINTLPISARGPTSITCNQALSVLLTAALPAAATGKADDGAPAS